MEQRRHLLNRIEGILLIPHELLHVIAFRLIGKRCQYSWGDVRVSVVEPLTYVEHLFTLALPLAVTSAVTAVSCLALALGTYLWLLDDPHQSQIPGWYLALGASWTMALFYTSLSWKDVLRIRQLLARRQSEQPPHEPNDDGPSQQPQW